MWERTEVEEFAASRVKRAPHGVPGSGKKLTRAEVAKILGVLPATVSSYLWQSRRADDGPWFPEPGEYDRHRMYWSEEDIREYVKRRAKDYRGKRPARIQKRS